MAPKCTYELDPDVKLSLHTWRGQLRRRGVKASEKAIIEALVEVSDLETVASLLSARTAKEKNGP
jgi:hypothetical protein